MTGGLRAAVTGASGLIGARVAQALRAAGYDVRAVVRSTSDLSALQGIPTATAELDDPGALRAAFAGCELLVHCAAVFAYDLPAERLHQVNVAGTESVLRAAAAAGVRRVVLTSSAVTCGSAEGPEPRTERDRPGAEYLPDYFTSKAEQERLALELGAALGIEVVAACPTTVLGGPDLRLAPSNALIVGYLLDLSRTTFPGGANFVSVKDVAAAHVLLAEAGVPGERYLIGGENLTWREFHRTIAELAGLPGPWLTANHRGAYLGAAAAELLAHLRATTPLVTRVEARTLGRHHYYDHGKIAALGYRPRPARTAIAEALSWLATSPHLPRLARESLKPAPEVYRVRELRARPLTPPGRGA
ncbi:NAD-dependent epimerase/dehydratase family protein [Crossiella cryophila]|uniref:Dihydroflavonol-4-reductase n=1 Tax=Crossiella cryophila TaxID=43355 RepID=A0A7W7CJL2_9PSEU|nr:NAD-dependent epimerase/dehydratase family protein [Crossiella cryophila]MBB4680644.1 dihydroflavonol-4-reductase [Crossiella cryophila]